MSRRTLPVLISILCVGSLACDEPGEGSDAELRGDAGPERDSGDDAVFSDGGLRAPDADDAASLREVYTQLTAGRAHSCALRDDGSLRCWGGDADGQVAGPNAATNQDFIYVSAGVAHTCALRASGRVKCWGSDVLGQVGGPNGDTAGDVIQLSAGGNSTCVVREGGTAYCWGDDAEGEVSGPNTDADQGFSQVSIQRSHSCALRTSAMGASIHCWGDSAAPQVSGPMDDVNDMGEGAEDILLVVTGGSHTCALREQGTLHCWGDDWSFQGDVVNGQVSGPNDDGATNFAQVAVGASRTCAVRTDGNLSCWGLGGDVDAEGDDGFVQVAVGHRFVCALRRNGAIRCWGADTDGQVSGPAGTLSVLPDAGTAFDGGQYGGALSDAGMASDAGQVRVPVTCATSCQHIWRVCDDMAQTCTDDCERALQDLQDSTDCADDYLAIHACLQAQPLFANSCDPPDEATLGPSYCEAEVTQFKECLAM